MNGDHYEPPGTRFLDMASGREMLLVSDGPWAGWLSYRHPDGQWVSLRKATDADLVSIERAGGPAAGGGGA